MSYLDMILGGGGMIVWCVRVRESRNQKHSSVPMHAQKTLLLLCVPILSVRPAMSRLCCVAETEKDFVGFSRLSIERRDLINECGRRLWF